MLRNLFLFLHRCRLRFVPSLRLGTLFYSSLFGEFGNKSVIDISCRIINPHFAVIGSSTHISRSVWINCNSGFSDDRKLKIGSNVYVGANCQINAWSCVEIEDFVMVADRVLITDADHGYRDAFVPIINQPITVKSPVILKKGCWIGINSVILPGVTIGKNSVVSANSVVVISVPDYCVVAGNPAKIIANIRS